MLKVASKDLADSFRRSHLIGVLGWQDIKQRYRRSALGPFWLTISMAATIATIGFVFGQIFGSPMREFLPFLTAGLVIWTYISTCLIESANAFIEAQAIVKQLPIPLPVHVFRVVWRNLIIFFHNILILPLVLLLTNNLPGWGMFYAVIGFILLVVSLSWACLLLALICARYRDMPQIIVSVLQFAFYITPVIWLPNLLSGKNRFALLDLNPFFHLIEIVRAPLIGQQASVHSWVFVLAVAMLGWVITLLFYNRTKHRIAYWV